MIWKWRGASVENAFRLDSAGFDYPSDRLTVALIREACRKWPKRECLLMHGEISLGLSAVEAFELILDYVVPRMMECERQLVHDATATSLSDHFFMGELPEASPRDKRIADGVKQLSGMYQAIGLADSVGRTRELIRGLCCDRKLSPGKGMGGRG
jgi:hypothetical protein